MNPSPDPGANFASLSPAPSPGANLTALHPEAERADVVTSMVSTEALTPANRAQSHVVPGATQFLAELSEMPSVQLYPSALNLDDPATELSAPPIDLPPLTEDCK